MNIISPKKINEYIGESVVGQKQARRVISTAMFLHFARCMSLGMGGKQFKKSNSLLMGPSGSGKTLIVREAIKAVGEISKYKMAPLLEIDCTSLSARGWEGDDVQDLLEEHYRANWRDKFALASTVVFLDEVDKMCMPAVGKSGTDHNRKTQYGLLKIVEGMKLPVAKDQHLDTSSMMFVFAGNFPQIRHLAAARAKPAMGFSGEIQPPVVDLHQQLEKGGMITQLVGRISSIGELDRLDRKQLRSILVDHILPEYKEMCDFLGYDMQASNYYIRKMVDEADSKGTGARGLQSAVDKWLEDDIYNMKFECPFPGDDE